MNLLSGHSPQLPALLDQSPEALRAWFAERGQPALRVKQVRRWVLAGRAESFEQMSDLPRDLRAELAKHFVPLGTRIERHLVATDETHKLLVRLADDRTVECVLIQEPSRRTACISTQVGCGMGCVFCASGLNGVVRNLTAGEILEQLVRLRNLVRPSPERERRGTASPVAHAPGSDGVGSPGRLTHIVVMGMG